MVVCMPICMHLQIFNLCAICCAGHDNCTNAKAYCTSSVVFDSGGSSVHRRSPASQSWYFVPWQLLQWMRLLTTAYETCCGQHSSVKSSKVSRHVTGCQVKAVMNTVPASSLEFERSSVCARDVFCSTSCSDGASCHFEGAAAAHSFTVVRILLPREKQLQMKPPHPFAS
ncbi:hypothetical protein ABBQ32_000966 [Trebouxia sp. C0010 RCD-2024]